MNKTIHTLNRTLAPAILPLSWVALLSIFILLYRAFGLPTPAEILPIAQRSFEAYGTPILVVAAFIECLFMISIYFPGSFVIAVAVVISQKTSIELLQIGTLSWIGFVGALAVNYWLGEKGFYTVLLKFGRQDIITNMQQRLARRGNIALFLTAIHPNFLAIAMVCLGIARRGIVVSTLKGAIFLIPWVSLIIGVLGVTATHVDVTNKNQAWYFVGLFLLWAVVEIVRVKSWREPPGIAST